MNDFESRCVIKMIMNGNNSDNAFTSNQSEPI